MSFKDIANSGLIWGCVIVGIILVVFITLYYMVVCYRHAIKVGVSKETVNAVVKSSATFSIVPSIAIVAGLATLAIVIGLPYAWFRLSVLGSVTYELMSANLALSALGLDVNTADAYAFGLMAWAMCIGITVTLLFNIFFAKKVHMGTLKLGDKDQKWGAVSQTVFMTALLCALIVPMIFGGVVSLLTFASSALIAVLITTLAKVLRADWLNQFTLAFSLIGAMALSVVYDGLF